MMKNAVVVPPAGMDRSPCGTGSGAKMATLYAKGELQIGEAFIHESIIGSLFVGRLVEETVVGNYQAVVSTITGSAWIMGIHQFVLDPDDPFPAGFLLEEQEKLYGFSYDT
jgi:proline racemase